MDDQFANPHGLAIDPEGNVWVADADDQVIYKMSPEGEVMQKLGGHREPRGGE